MSPRPPALRPIAFAALAIGFGLGALCPAPKSSAGDPAPAKPDESVAFFKTGPIPRLQVDVDDEGMATWKKDPRQWVRCTVRENDKTLYDGVGVKSKGAIGSTRPIDDKPGLTLKFDKFGGDAGFHGLEKGYLNNSVQDETFLNEWLGSEVFRAAGLAAPRISHARVWLNGRDLGLYVLKEGHDKRFLKRNFEDAGGNLYDSGLGQDIDSQIERDEGKGQPDWVDVQDLHAACMDPDPVHSHAAIAAHLDVDRFLTFMALERMLCHWDGYCGNRNNYRLYFHRGKACFVPHGMDQLLGDVKASVFDDPVAIVGIAVMRDTEWHAAYYKRIGELLAVLNPVDRWLKRIDDAASRLKPALGGAQGPQNVGGLKTAFSARVKALQQQAKQPEPEPLALEVGESLKMRAWRPERDEGDVKLALTTIGAERALRWQAGNAPASIGTWHATVYLAPGRYRFEGEFMTDAVAPVGPPATAGVSIHVLRGPRSERLSGTGSWKPLSATFNVGPGARRMEIVLEMRASKGTAHARVGSLKLTRVEG